MIGPIMVEPSQTEVEATVGRFLNFNVGDNPGQWEISSDNEAVVTVEQGGERDGATFNPGGEAVGVGEATVTLTDTEGNPVADYPVHVAITGAAQQRFSAVDLAKAAVQAMGGQGAGGRGSGDAHAAPPGARRPAGVSSVDGDEAGAVA